MMDWPELYCTTVALIHWQIAVFQKGINTPSLVEHEARISFIANGNLLGRE